MTRLTVLIITMCVLGCTQAVYPPRTIAQEQEPVVEPAKSATVLRLELQVIQGKMATMQLQFPMLQAKEKELIAQLKVALAREKKKE